jgi:hypothetical protein
MDIGRERRRDGAETPQPRTVALQSNGDGLNVLEQFQKYCSRGKELGRSLALPNVAMPSRDGKSVITSRHSTASKQIRSVQIGALSEL